MQDHNIIQHLVSSFLQQFNLCIIEFSNFLQKF